MGEGSLAVVGIGFQSSGPGIELFPGGPMPECANVGKGHAGLAERIDHPGVGQLALGVVAIPRSRVHGRRSEETFGRIGSQAFGRDPRSIREFSDGHEAVHGMKHGPCPVVRVKWDRCGSPGRMTTSGNCELNAPGP